MVPYRHTHTPSHASTTCCCGGYVQFAAAFRYSGVDRKVAIDTLCHSTFYCARLWTNVTLLELQRAWLTTIT